MSITFSTAQVKVLDVFASAHDDTLIHEYDIDALSAQIEYLVNEQGMDFDTLRGAEFWAIAEPYRW